MPLETVGPAATTNQAASSEPVGTAAAPALDQVIRAIAGDAAQSAGEYLRDTEVPHGGE